MSRKNHYKGILASVTLLTFAELSIWRESERGGEMDAVLVTSTLK